MLYESSDEGLLKQVLSSRAYAALTQRLDIYETELATVEREMAKLKAREKKLKTNLAYELTHGRERD
jgi:predicted  nucleic acid-binding Zn-ribbon protein